MQCLHLAPARPMLSILLRSDLRDHLLVHLETRTFAYFLIFIRVDSAPSAGLLASLALQLLRKQKNKYISQSPSMIWSNIWDKLHKNVSNTEGNHTNAMNNHYDDHQKWLVPAPWSMASLGWVLVMCMQKALTFGSLVYWLCTKGQIWQPQVAHFMHIYLVKLLVNMFVASVVYTQGWELGSPDLIPAQLLDCCMPLDNLLSASVSAGLQPSPQSHADLCKIHFVRMKWLLLVYRF